jgi:hypothetical protein
MNSITIKFTFNQQCKLSTREEHRLRAYEKSAEVNILTRKKEATGKLRKLHYDKSHNFWGNEINMGKACSIRHENEICIQNFGQKTLTKGIIITMQTWEDVHLTERGGEEVEWTQMPQNRIHWWAIVNTVINLQVSGKYEIS